MRVDVLLTALRPFLCMPNLHWWQAEILPVAHSILSVEIQHCPAVFVRNAQKAVSKQLLWHVQHVSKAALELICLCIPWVMA